VDDDLGSIIMSKEDKHLRMMGAERIRNVRTQQLDIRILLGRFLEPYQLTSIDTEQAELLTSRAIRLPSSRFQKP
jgi:hypothetical protein